MLLFKNTTYIIYILNSILQVYDYKLNILFLKSQQTHWIFIKLQKYM